MSELLERCRPRLDELGVDEHLVLWRATDRAVEDLLAFARRDPAAHSSWEYVLRAYSSFRAVAAYRVAHELLEAPGRDREGQLVEARLIMERVKVRTGVEIHPAARIGSRFVIDHGTGTVIGEDVVVGSDTYLLQGVVLGAFGIADNVPGRRHPTLGDRVEIGGFARVLGPVSIGDGVVIGAHTMVRSDVRAHSRVTVVQAVQVVVGVDPIPIRGAVELLDLHCFRLHGDGLDAADVCVDLLDSSWSVHRRSDWQVLYACATSLTIELGEHLGRSDTVRHIRVARGDSEVVVGVPSRCGVHMPAARVSDGPAPANLPASSP